MTFGIDDHYTFVKFARESYPPHRPLPLGYSFSGEIPRQVERSLLEREFQAWSIPFNREMPGSRPDGVLSIHYGEEPIGIVFICDQNELELPGYGQLHYAAFRTDHRGRGLYGPLFAELARIGDRWGLRGLLINGDRVGLPEVYRSWGAELMFEKPKSPQAPPRLPQRLVRRFRRVIGWYPVTRKA
jgi:hypothetical protein